VIATYFLKPSPERSIARDDSIDAPRRRHRIERTSAERSLEATDAVRFSRASWKFRWHEGERGLENEKGTVGRWGARGGEIKKVEN